MIKGIDNICDEYFNIKTVCEDNDSHYDRKILSDYEATNYLSIEEIFKKYPFDKNDHLVDFGCGKGRIIIMAAYYSCKYITGYELDTDRYLLLLENIKNFQAKFQIDSFFSMFNVNVEKIEIDDTMNKFFFFNPFHLNI